MMTKLIKVTKGAGEGNTKLSSFDAALFAAGIANYNLIHLSSIIPDGFEPVKEKVNFNQDEFGYRLYVVMASQTEQDINKEAWAGVGWVMSKDKPKHGLFVEHCGGTEKEVVEQIKSSLKDMVSYRPEKFGDIQYEVAGIKCQDKPVCALVAAIYKSEKW